MYILLLSLSSLGPGSVFRVEVTLRQWNNLLQLLLRLAGTCSTASEGLMRCVPTGSGDLDASDLVSFSFAHGGVRKVEAAASQRNKVRRPSLHFVVSSMMAIGLCDASFSDSPVADVGGDWYLVLVDECVM